MLTKYFQQSFDGMRGENKFMRIALLCTVILLFIQHCANQNKEQIITIVPPTMTETGWLSKTSAGSEYTESWAMYVAMLLGNVTPQNAGIVKDSLGSLLAPDLYQDVMAVMDNQIHQIRQDRVSMSFEPDKILRDPDNLNRLYVTGRSTTEGVTGNKVRTNRTYEVDLIIRNYKPVIQWVSTYAGGPRTAEVIARERAIEERQEKLNNR